MEKKKSSVDDEVEIKASGACSLRLEHALLDAQVVACISRLPKSSKMVFRGEQLRQRARKMLEHAEEALLSGNGGGQGNDNKKKPDGGVSVLRLAVSTLERALAKEGDRGKEQPSADGASVAKRRSRKGRGT